VMWKREIRRRDGGVLWDDGIGLARGGHPEGGGGVKRARVRERCVVGNQSTETVG